jgi:hypothetical protein
MLGSARPPSAPRSLRHWSRHTSYSHEVQLKLIIGPEPRMMSAAQQNGIWNLKSEHQPSLHDYDMEYTIWRKTASVPPIDHEQWQQWMKQARCSTIVRWWLLGSPAGSREPRPSCCCWVAQPKPTKEHNTLSFRNRNNTKAFCGFSVDSWKVLILRTRNTYLQAIVGLHFHSLDT